MRRSYSSAQLSYISATSWLLLALVAVSVLYVLCKGSNLSVSLNAALRALVILLCMVRLAMLGVSHLTLRRRLPQRPQQSRTSLNVAWEVISQTRLHHLCGVRRTTELKTKLGKGLQQRLLGRWACLLTQLFSKRSRSI